jgi:tetratricopeptide (TPR) repeat protein
MLRAFLLSILLFGAASAVWAQPASQSLPLAMQYYQTGEMAKAAELFENVLRAEPGNATAYAYLYVAYLQLQQAEKAEKLAAGMAKRDPSQAAYEVDRAYALRQQQEEKRALNIYEGLLKKLGPNRGQIMMLTNAFRNRGENDWALRSLQQGRKLLAEPLAFSLELADLYLATGRKGEMVAAYLDYLQAAPQQLGYVQNMLQSRLTDEDYELLRQALLAGMQRRPEDLALAELMVWFFVQQLDFETAFYQAKALDQRLNENGQRMLSLARAAVENKQFKSAGLFYAYLVEKGSRHPAYYEARYELLDARRQELEAAAAGKGEWELLSNAFADYLRDFPQHRQVLLVKKGHARVLAYELQQFEAAVLLLEKAVADGGERRMLAAVKLDLGDLYLLTEEYWEAALVYGQVEKDFPNDPLGQEAKFRNARLSFFQAEFAWSQAQLDVLKASTSQRIANDAMALSLLISDNLNLDTSILPMRSFAAAELLAFRQDVAGATQAFEQMLVDFKDHALSDEVYLRLARLQTKQGNYTAARQWYERIIEAYAQDILGDDAHFELAVLLEEKLKDTAEAQRWYEKLLKQYPDSTFTFEARRRYRQLRGDQIN